MDVSELVEPGDVLVIGRNYPGMMRRGFEASDTAVIRVVAADPRVVLGAEAPAIVEVDEATQPVHRAAVALGGVVDRKVDATYGPVWPGDLLVTLPPQGHAMQSDAPLPGTFPRNALQPRDSGQGTIQALIMLLWDIG